LWPITKKAPNSSSAALMARNAGDRPAVLAAVNVTSRHAMQRYVDDQVTRVPWDVSVYQTADVPQAGKVLVET
jgi:hypothetical protein